MKLKNPQPSLKCAFAAFAATLVLLSGAEAADKFKILHEFLDKPAMGPSAALVADSAGNLYGTTRHSIGCEVGCGVVFELAPRSGGHWAYNVIHRFSGPDGTEPITALIVDSAGNLYGTTQLGGANGLGTVFEVSPSGGKWKEKVLYSFGAGDLYAPNSALTFDTSGNLYGTTSFGGAGWGGVFELKPSGGGWKERILYSFTQGADGSGASGGALVWDSAGDLYGTTGLGGKHNRGVLFELKPSSDGGWTEVVLYSFPRGFRGTQSGVTFDTAGNLYGTTGLGGLTSCNPPFGCGAVFKLTLSGGVWAFHVLHRFNGSDGWYGYNGVKVDSAGNLYGETYAGGSGYGLAYKLALSGGFWKETVLHSFDLSDGANPVGGLIFGPGGALMGVTENGGTQDGVVFSVTP
jgi:uncharacterized repeat protein (TIGR03803 family)